jgi:5-formyltetrahydrofolate cyclo-ligase
MMRDSSSLSDQKRLLRAEALSRREAQPDKDAVSRRIIERLVSLPVYQSASAVLFYVDVRSEVRTRWFFPEVLKAGKGLIVPYCVGAELELFRLSDLSELVPGRFGILEPDPILRSFPDRRVLAGELDLLIVPGVAFDRGGGRMGHGFGFYDRLLKSVRPDTPKFGLAFECQIVTEVPMEPHDVALDGVVTESAVYASRISAR